MNKITIVIREVENGFLTELWEGDKIFVSKSIKDAAEIAMSLYREIKDKQENENEKK